MYAAVLSVLHKPVLCSEICMLWHFLSFPSIHDRLQSQWFCRPNRCTVASLTLDRGTASYVTCLSVVFLHVNAARLLIDCCREQFFEDEIAKVRSREMALHWKNAHIKNINITMVFGTPPTTACVIFAAYEMMVGRLQATLAFTTLSLFNILRFPLVVLPKALRALSEALASIQRVEEFLLQDVPTDAEGVTKATRTGVKIVSSAAAAASKLAGPPCLSISMASQCLHMLDAFCDFLQQWSVSSHPSAPNHSVMPRSM